MTSYTNPTKVPEAALALLRHLASFDGAYVTMERWYPLPPRYFCTYHDGFSNTRGPASERDIATLATLSAITLTAESRNGNEHTSQWRITDQGRAILDAKGILSPPQEVPELFDTTPYTKPRTAKPSKRGTE